MLYAGGILLLVGALIYLCYTYAQWEQRRVRDTEGFLLLVRHIRSELDAYRAPLARALERFQNEALEERGFLPLARERGLASALAATGSRFSLDREEWGALHRFAEGVGAPLLRDALALCEDTEVTLARVLDKRRRDLPARTRAGCALLAFCGLTLLLLLG